MRHLFYLVLISILHSCNYTQSNHNNSSHSDTIQTNSGLKYYYLKKGEGRKIEKGCEVKAYLSLTVGDSVVWNTDQMPDSAFAFVAGHTNLIKGFTEMSLLLQEGDEVVAIMPDSIAYGARGAGKMIPPNATIIYDQFRVLNVGAPKAILKDTLHHELTSNGIQSMINRYRDILSGHSNEYIIDTRQLGKWIDTLLKESNPEVLEVARLLADETNDKNIKTKYVMALYAHHKYQLAIEYLNEMLNEHPNDIKLKTMLNHYQKQLDK